MESGKIYQSLGAVMKAIAPIDKNRKNEQQNFMFRGIEDFMNTIHSLLAENDIIILPSEKEHIQETFTTAKGGVQFRSRIHVFFKFVSTQDGSFVEADGWGEAADTFDKGYNKCKSIALKYALSQMFLVPTKEIADPDKETPDSVVSKENETDQDLELALQLVKEAKNTEELQKVWNDNSGYKKNKAFFKAVQDKNRELSKDTGA